MPSTEVPGPRGGRAPLDVWIAHGSIVGHDAIGTDIMGMREILVECGFQVRLIAEHFGDSVRATGQAVRIQDAMKAISPDILIYHHSIHWPAGESLLAAHACPRLLKYHNVTPPEFFRDYSLAYTNSCTEGRRQTDRLVSLFRPTDSLSAASAYNAAEFGDRAVAPVYVAPPFTKVARFLRPPRDTVPEPPYSALFVGRMAPHKGHFDLLTIVAAYKAAFGPTLRLTVVGGLDEDLQGYGLQIREQIRVLGIGDQVRIVDRVTDTELRRLFDDADLFLCMSSHEGFCVPIIEAQASGIPVVSRKSGALEETVGIGQLLVDDPVGKKDFAYIARLIHAVCTEPALRRQLVNAGYRNVLDRFSPPRVADRFIESLSPLLESAA